MEEIKIRMTQTVKSSFPFACKPGTILKVGEEYPGKSNPHGAISGLCNNGEWLGVCPGEFEFVEAPEWLLKIWGK